MRAVLWTALAGSFLIGLTPQASGLYFIDTVAPPEHTFADLFSLLRNEMESVLIAVRKHIIDAEDDLDNFIDKYVKPTAKDLLKYSEDDLEAIGLDFINVEDKIMSRYKMTKDDFRTLLIFNPTQLLEEIMEIIGDKETKLTQIIIGLNLTDDPELLSQMLQAIYDYPQSKHVLGSLIRENVEVIIYSKYLQFSDHLREELKQDVDKIVKCIDKSQSSGVYSSSRDDADAITITLGINALIDFIFDEANFRNKKLLNRLVPYHQIGEAD